MRPGTSIERYCVTIKVRAERRCGELLREMEKAKGGTLAGRDSDGRAVRPTETKGRTLSDLGITKDQSSRYQRRL